MAKKQKLYLEKILHQLDSTSFDYRVSTKINLPFWAFHQSTCFFICTCSRKTTFKSYLTFMYGLPLLLLWSSLFIAGVFFSSILGFLHIYHGSLFVPLWIFLHIYHGSLFVPLWIFHSSMKCFLSKKKVLIGVQLAPIANLLWINGIFFSWKGNEALD